MLPAITDLLLEGPGQRQIYKARPSVFRSFPSVSFAFKFCMSLWRLIFPRAMAYP